MIFSIRARLTLVVALLALTMGATLLQAPVAAAAEVATSTSVTKPDPLDPEVTVSIVDTQGPLSQMAGASRCTWASRTTTYRAPGVVLYSLTMRVDWCFDGKNVVGTPVRTSAYVESPAWSFGRYTSLEMSKLDNTAWLGFTQAQFKLNPFGPTRSPFIRMRVNGDGTYSATSGG